MAGPSVAVRVLGDVKGLVDTFSGVGTKAATVAASAHQAFSGMLGALNQTGVLGPFGAALDGIDTAIGKISEHGKSIGTTMMGVGGALVGVGAGLQALGSKDQAAHQQLQAAVEASGHDYEDYAGKVDKAIKSNEKYGDSAVETQDALRILTQATGDPAKALQYLGTATDLAAAKHESLDTAATQLGKTYNGSAKLMKEFGATAEKSADTTAKMAKATKDAQTADENAAKAKQHLADVQESLKGKTTLTQAETIRLRDAQAKVTETSKSAADAHSKLAGMTATVVTKTQAAGDNMSVLADKLKGQASAAADTFGGKMSALKAKIEDSAAAFGQKFGPAITAAGAVMTGLGATMQIVTGIRNAMTTATEAGTVATETMTAADEAAAVAEGVALGPILLIIAAIALVGVAIYELVTHWSTVWATMKAVVQDVWQWIQKNWPLLVDIIFGPIGIAVTQVIAHWSAIKAAFQDAWNWVAKNWPLLVEILTGPIGWAVGVIMGNWGTIKQGASDAVAWIKGVWGGMVGWVTGLGGQIASAAAGMWNGITGAFRSAINGVIGLWNEFASLTALHIHVQPIPGLPGINVDTGQLIPSISPLAAGGIVTGPTLALIGEQGPEAVIPLNSGAMGPAVHIEHATFTDQADVDLLLRRAAWAARTRVI